MVAFYSLIFCVRSRERAPLLYTVCVCSAHSLAHHSITINCTQISCFAMYERIMYRVSHMGDFQVHFQNFATYCRRRRNDSISFGNLVHEIMLQGTNFSSVTFANCKISYRLNGETITTCMDLECFTFSHTNHPNENITKRGEICCPPKNPSDDKLSLNALRKNIIH